MLNVHVKRLTDQAVIPTKVHHTDAGWDLYCDEEVWLDDDPSRVSTGISIAVPEGYYAQIQGRSGLASKGIYVFPGVVDAGFRGEVEVVMAYQFYDDENYHFMPGDKIAQFVILPVPEARMVDVGNAELPRGERGVSGWGSSDEASPLDDMADFKEAIMENSTGLPSDDDDLFGPSDDEFWGHEQLAKEKMKLARERNPGAFVILSPDFKTMTITRPGGDPRKVGEAEVTIGGTTIRVGGVVITPDGEGGFTRNPIGKEENQKVAEAIGKLIQDSQEATQDAPGRPQDGGKVESPRVDQVGPGKAYQDFHRTSGWVASAVKDAMEGQPFVIHARIQAQMDFWKGEATRLCESLAALKKELASVGEQCRVFQEDNNRLMEPSQWDVINAAFVCH